MLEFVALARLEPNLFSVVVQSKLLTTALFTTVLLGKRLRMTQIVALLLLLAGVVTAQTKNGASASQLSLESEQMVGVTATLGIATLSGFAAVYTERVLKRGGGPAAHGKHMLACMQARPRRAPPPPVRARARPCRRDASSPRRAQIQMATASLLIIGVFALAQDSAAILEGGLWQGFDMAAGVAVLSSALGGLIVSAVLKYADSVLKGYATSGSVMLTGVLSAIFFGTALDARFLFATVLVISSIVLYNTKPGATSGNAT